MRPFDLRKYVIAMMVSFVLLFGTTAVQAGTFELDFTADFTTGPILSISGSIAYEADGINSAITSLKSIDLTIGDYVYTLDEVGFISPYGLQSIIGGTLTGVGAIVTGTNDFWIRFYHFDRSPTAYDFLYGKVGETKNYQSVSFSQFSLTEVTDTGSVPEATSLLLLGFGLVSLAGVRRRIKK